MTVLSYNQNSHYKDNAVMRQYSIYIRDPCTWKEGLSVEMQPISLQS